jgi:hypothetical protein
MKSTWIAGLAAAALAVPVVIASPAQAGAYRPVGERTLANSSMSAADIPRWMRHGGAPRVERVFNEGRKAARPDLCPQEIGDYVVGMRPQQSMASTAITREDEASGRGTAIESVIFQYRTRSDAERAWADLNARARTCPSYVQEEASDFSRGRVEVNTRVGTLRSVFGTPGLEVVTDYTADITFEVNDVDVNWLLVADQHANYYLAGTSIVGVRYANVMGQSFGVGRVTQGFVQTMAIVLAQRVESRSAR